MKLWPWQHPGTLPWFAIGGAYELAYAAPARERQAGTSGLRGYATALRLREAGFAIVHTPGRIRGGVHATVVWPADDPLNHQEVPWPPGVPALFDECFNG